MAEFPNTWGLLQGGPGSATETIPIYLYLITWQFFDISKAAATSYVVMFIMIFVILFAIRILRKEKQSMDTLYSVRSSGS